MGKAKVFIVDREHQSDYKVFFVDRDNQEKNQAIIEGGQLVDRANNANVKVYIVDRQNKGDILITRKNFPK